AEELISSHPTIELTQLIQKRDQLVKEIQESTLIKLEKQEIERLLKPLRDIIVDKQEKQLLDLSDDERKTLENLKCILKDRKERRQEIKNQLKTLRQSVDSFDVDFEKTMSQVNEEEDRLEKTSLGIKEVETKIQFLQSQLKAKNDHI
ncbi:MAG: hypothetical protein Q8K60_08100, partial [Parachlamydiaceae bacterium]|nr:hypothetical protein [Parachlamydiaceae bacterium]